MQAQKTKKSWLRRTGHYLYKKRAGYLFLLPFLILFTLFTILPVLAAIVNSFQYYNVLQPATWRGFTNYEMLFTNDDIFIIALKNTFLFSVIVGPIGYMLSFVFAWVINNYKRKRFMSLVFYVPSIASAVAMSSVWLYFFSNDKYGLFNQILLNLKVIQKPILFLSDPNYVLWVIIVISLWMSMGNGFLVFLAGFQNISPEWYEAGAIDGISNRFQQLWYITLPSMKPQLLFGAITSISSSFGVFDVSVTVAGLPSPKYAAHTLVTHMYDAAFNKFEMGYACAVAVVLFIITFSFSQICMKVFSTQGE